MSIMLVQRMIGKHKGDMQPVGKTAGVGSDEERVVGVNDLEAEARNQAMERSGGGRDRQGIAVMSGNAEGRKSIDIRLRLAVSRIPLREDEDPVAKATQVSGELLNGDCQAVQQRGGVAGKKTDGHRCSESRVSGFEFRVQA